jgi:LIM and senescent cell antigen-like-containing domain protein 1/2
VCARADWDWVVQHFVCAKCEKPFSGARFYEFKGLAYCRMHYQQVAGEMCFHCSQPARGQCTCWLASARDVNTNVVGCTQTCAR